MGNVGAVFRSYHLRVVFPLAPKSGIGKFNTDVSHAFSDVPFHEYFLSSHKWYAFFLLSKTLMVPIYIFSSFCKLDE